jgi:Outer membrane protein beta-barrel domain
MKKHFLTILAVVAMMLSAEAQITIIPKLGADISNVAFTGVGLNGTLMAGPKVGLLLGTAVEVGVTDVLAVQPEILFIQKGYKRTNAGTTTISNVNYLEIPVLAKVKVKIQNITFFTIAGPVVSLAISGKEKKGEETTEIKIGSENSNTKKIDFSLQFGAGVMYKNFVFDLRYGVSLTNSVVVTTGGDYSTKNRVISFTVGYSLPLGFKFLKKGKK